MTVGATANEFTSKARDKFLKLVSAERDSVLMKHQGMDELNMYVRYNIDVDKRNFVLFAVPSMYPVSHGARKFAGETFNKLLIKDFEVYRQYRLSSVGNLPKQKDVVSIIRTLLVPNVYGENIYKGFILSPLSYKNRRLYRYLISRLTGNRVEIVFRPKIKNTQLISGKAIIDSNTGRILLMEYNGELDFVNFSTVMVMPKEKGAAFPDKCETKIRFKFLGNKLKAHYTSIYNLAAPPLDSVSSGKVKMEMDSVRPFPVTREMAEIYQKEEERKNVQKKESQRSFGDFFVDNISGNFGKNAQGKFKLSPLINPLYVGYSNKKGVTYRMRLNGTYNFSDKSNIALTANIGYSFRQKQFYLNIPLRLTLGKSFYFETEYGGGNRITNSEILEHVKNESYDSIRWDKMNLDYFRDMYWRFRINITLLKKWNVRPGIAYHRRSAINKGGFIISGRPSLYRSFSPTLQLQFKPMLDNGPVFTVDYERGIKGVFKSDMNYERIETDLSWKKKLYCMRQLSMKAGYGFYTSRSKGAYFLDYSNFKYDNIPGGWNDDWTGEFQMLNSNWYNASKYYVRSNLTYDSPILLLSKLPIVGKYLEMERVYFNMLFTESLHPYMEYGYGFTNKFFSAGIFCATAGKNFEGVGVRFGLELFKDW